MKLLLVLALVCVAAQSTWATGDDLGGVFASMDGPIAQATESYGTFMQTTANATCHHCGCTSCCPVIVRNCPPKWVGSVIQPFSGWRGNAAIIIDWGCTAWTPCFQCTPRNRICTINDKGYVWYVDWGDGTRIYGYQRDIGPFQKVHQYSKDCRTRSYRVTVYFCSNPGCPYERCCDSLYHIIDVSEDPQHGLSEIDFNKPLKDN